MSKCTCHLPGVLKGQCRAASHGALPPVAGSAVRVLRLTLKRKWFDMISSGKKLEEYRDPSPWIYSRLLQKDGYTHRKYDLIEFRNGYGPTAPTMTVEFKGWKHGLGMPKWGATPGLRYVVILLGRVISRRGAD